MATAADVLGPHLCLVTTAKLLYVDPPSRSLYTSAKRGVALSDCGFTITLTATAKYESITCATNTNTKRVALETRFPLLKSGSSIR